jgi:hypothetical protein
VNSRVQHPVARVSQSSMFLPPYGTFACVYFMIAFVLLSKLVNIVCKELDLIILLPIIIFIVIAYFMDIEKSDCGGLVELFYWDRLINPFNIIGEV